MKKVIVFIICFAMFLTYLPMPEAWADTADSESALPQTAEAYAQSDYAKYGARMTAGKSHMAVVKADGTVVAWGDDTYGQTDVPEGLSNVKAIAAGTNHTLALKEDGTIAGWGSSIYNVDKDTAAYTIPAELENVQFKSIAAGENMSAAVKTDGSVVVWGYNSASFHLETIPSGLKNVVSVAINSNGAAALDKSGYVTYWGDRSNITLRIKPPTCGGIVAVEPGFKYWLALKNDGTAVAWGNPIQKSDQIKTQSDIRAISAGHRMSAALLKDGSVKTFCNGSGPIPFNSNGEKLNTAQNVAAVFVTPEWMQKCHALIMQKNGKVIAYSSDSQLSNMLKEEINLLSNPTGPSDADLSGLAVGGYSLTPAFSAATTEYTVSVPNNVTEVAITATASSDKAALKINEQAAESGTPYTVKALKVGDNTIAVKVTAENGTEKTYTLTIKVEGNTGQSNADLSSLTVEGYNLSPVFDAGVTGYAISVPNPVTCAAVTATASSDKAALKINEQAAESGTPYTVKDLKVGDNTIAVKVTAEDGTTEKTYTITIKVEDNTGQSNNADLNSLTVEGYELSPSFASTVINYEIHNVLPNDVTGIAVTAVTSDSKATLTINSDKIVTDTAYTVDLYVGENPIPVKVTAENGDVKTYTITVQVAEYEGTSSPGIPQTMKAYEASEYTQAFNKIVGSGNFIFINQDGSIKRFKNPARYQNAVGKYDLPDNLKHVKKVVELNFNVLALKEDGTVVAWGSEDTGVCDVPEGLSGVEDVGADRISEYAMALKEDGTVVVWGKNTYGECNVPKDLRGVKQIFAGRHCCLALKEDGKVAAWGDSPSDLCDVPEGLSGVTDMVINSEGSYALALKEDGTVVAWGCNDHGECNVPSDLKNVSCIKADLNNAIAVKEDGSPVIWGDNRYGVCDVPKGLKDVVSVAMETGVAVALRANGTVAAWGNKSSKVKNMPAGLHDVAGIKVKSAWNGPRIWAVKKDGTLAIWGSEWGYGDIEARAINVKNIISIGGDFLLCRGGILECYGGHYVYSSDVAEIQKVVDGVNVLSGHYFSVSDAELLNSEGQEVTSMNANESYKIKARIDNYYCEDTKCNVIIQVRGGDGASISGGGSVISCTKQESDVPLEGVTVSVDFTMPENISGPVYIDVFAWDKGDKPAPKAAPDQSLMITVN